MQQHAEAHGELVASHAGSGSPMPHAGSSPAASSDAGDAHAAAKAWGDGKLDSASAGEDAHGVIKTMAGLSPSKGSIEWDALVPSGELLP